MNGTSHFVINIVVRRNVCSCRQRVILEAGHGEESRDCKKRTSSRSCLHMLTIQYYKLHAQVNELQFIFTSCILTLRKVEISSQSTDEKVFRRDVKQSQRSYHLHTYMPQKIQDHLKVILLSKMIDASREVRLWALGHCWEKSCVRHLQMLKHPELV